MKIDIDAVIHLKKFVARYPTQRAAAEALGVSRQFLVMMLGRKEPVSPRVLRQLGLRTTIVVATAARRAAAVESDERAS